MYYYLKACNCIHEIDDLNESEAKACTYVDPPFSGNLETNWNFEHTYYRPPNILCRKPIQLPENRNLSSGLNYCFNSQRHFLRYDQICIRAYTILHVYKI